MGPGAGLDVVEQILPTFLGVEQRFFYFPARSLATIPTTMQRLLRRLIEVM
jgi:hypothetical protein